MPTGFTTGITVVTKSLPDGIVGVPYEAYTLDALDYTPPIGWALQAGSLPPGMAVSAPGVVSGTPTQVGTFTFTMRATDGVPDVKDQVMTIRIGPDLGNVRRFQQETVVEDGTSVIPIEGSAGRSDLRRKLERLLARLLGSQIVDRYMLDAVDLQIRNFDGTPIQSMEDALLNLLGQIAGAARAIDDGSGAPYITPGAVDGEFKIIGLGSIQVAKNIGTNELEISFTGAPLAMPFDMLPAPSGDASGVTDTAAITALLAGAHQDWLFSPQDEADDPYYINADLGAALGSGKYRLSGKSRAAFRIVGVGALRTWNEVSQIDNATLTDVRISSGGAGIVPRYEDCDLLVTLAAAVLVSTGANAARFLRCGFTFAEVTAALYDGQNGGQQLAMTECRVLRTVSNASSFLIRTGAAASNTYLSLVNCFLGHSSGLGIDLTAIHAAALLMLNMNVWSGTGVAITRGATPSNLGSRYMEALQSIGGATFNPL